MRTSVVSGPAAASPSDGAAARATRLLAAYTSTSTPVCALVIAGILAGAWVVNDSVGTKSAGPHLFYLPIILAALHSGIRAALLTSAVAAAICSLVPVDVVSGEAQAVSAVVLRALMFALVGVVASGALALRRSLDREQHLSELREIYDRRAGRAPADAVLVSLVPDVLARSRFHPVFQPIYSLLDGDLLGVEALTRFDAEPPRPPDHWFEAATFAGLGADLELAAISAALRAARALPAQVDLALNISPATLDDPRLGAVLADVGGRQIVLELTEHAVIDDYDALRARLAELRLTGVQFAVDDAGAGFASLQHIVQMAPDVIKLDISLTQDVASSPARKALGGALIAFAHSTRAVLVVEGIESQADLDEWTALGADAVQGYLVGRPEPLPADGGSLRRRAHVGGTPRTGAAVGGWAGP